MTVNPWAKIDYRPAVEALLPLGAMPFLGRVRTALDIGCGVGGAAMFLAQQGLDVTGVDLNRDAIEAAQRTGILTTSAHRPEFHVADVASDNCHWAARSFDLVLLMRVLTCFPNREDREAVLGRARSCVRPGGLLYVNDFVMVPESPVYGSRYRAGLELDLGPGNFEVRDSSGKLAFVAHHFSKSEIADLVAPHKTLSYSEYDSLSMNGNPCRMFEFLGEVESVQDAKV